MALCGSLRCGCGITSTPAVEGALDGELPSILVEGSGEAGDPWNLMLNDGWAAAVINHINAADTDITAAELAIGAAELDIAALETDVAALTASWISYSPTLSNITIGNGTQTHRYLRFGPTGKTIIVFNEVVFGTTTALTGWGLFGPPFTLRSASTIWGQGTMSDISLGTNYLGFVLGSTTLIGPTAIGTAGSYASAGFTGASIPFVWASGDTLRQVYMADLP
jgi:hypothetical protein